MNQQDVEKWITQNGGSGRVKYSRSTQKVANPAKQITRPDGTDNPDYDPTAPSTIDVSEEKWIAVDAEGKPTGAELHARRRPDGDFDVVDQSDPNPTRASGQDAAPPGGKPYIDDGPEAGQSGRRWGWNPTTKAYDRDLGSSPSAQKPPAPTSKSDRKPVPTHPGYYEVTTADAATGKSEAHYEDAQGTRVEKLPPTEAETRANAPKPQQDGMGGWGYVDTSSGKPQWVNLPNIPGSPPKIVPINGVYGYFHFDSPTSEPRFIQVDVPKPGVTLKNVDAWEPDFAQPDLGVGKWAAAQRGKIGLPAEQGGITQDDWDKAGTEARERAGVIITNVTNATSTVRQHQQDQEGLRNTRSKEAESDFSSALGAFSTLTSKGGFDPDSGSLKNVIPGLLWEMNKNREERTAKTPTLPGLHPLFQIASAQSAATAKPPAVQEQAAGTGPSPAPYEPPGAPAPQPNALGLGAVPGSIAPNAAPVPPPPAAPVAAAPMPAPAIAAPAMAAPPPAAPPAMPNPNVGQPGDPIMPPSISPSTGEPTGLSPLPQDGQFPQQPDMTQVPMTPPAQPSTYGPSGDMQKVSMGDGPLSSFASSALGSVPPPQSQQGEGGGGPFDSLMRSAAGGGFDPFDAAARLVSMGAPREVVAQALAQSGMLQKGRRVA